MKAVNKIKPILFSTPMVKALELLKTQTRRLLKSFNPDYPIFKGIGRRHKLNVPDPIETFAVFENEFGERIKIKSPYQVGDVIWVRETWRVDPHGGYDYKSNYTTQFCNHPNNKVMWMPSIFMPKDAARIFLNITDVRVERIQDITEKDAEAEGVKIDEDGFLCWDYMSNKWLPFGNPPQESFKTLWQSIKGTDSWNENPWVWVFSFEVMTKPESFNT
ncbi:Uncharacterised protein [Sphingobacterium spiritivorum]|uniref:Uncharacterized protein n=1 Tax=Sphingobacterium spiritivorum TaxID=258 RepID=A0A380CRY6_SPHSI|nr:hypothetical protein [Sphingobacterium spiritivorum]SUJ26416.1 Uncharacterised protein [Sphingobacterium spiritivorum]